VRGNAYSAQDWYEEALADYTRAADEFRRRKDLLGLWDAERRMRSLHLSRIGKETPRGPEKAERLN
jgi:hypothetical protein